MIFKFQTDYLDLAELNDSVKFVLAFSNKTKKYIKCKHTGVLVVFINENSYTKYKNISNVLKNSEPKVLPIKSIEMIAKKVSKGEYKIVDY